MNTTPGMDCWHVGEAYERYMGRWSRRLAPRFVRWLEVPAGQRWLDVGCGTGSLVAAIVGHAAPAAVASLQTDLRRRLPPQVGLQRASADALPFAEGSFDATVSALVLNFVPDVGAALREMVRVSADGGVLAACVWDYAQAMRMIRAYWDAAAQLGLLNPGQDEGERFTLCRPHALADAFAGAGLRDVVVAAIDLDITFADFDDYWQPFLGGQGPAPSHATSLAESQRERLRERLRRNLGDSGELRPDGAIVLPARAWAVRGRPRHR
jgi:SAM-dependent methyltransferase